jgi:homocitrate synthase NifV
MGRRVLLRDSTLRDLPEGLEEARSESWKLDVVGHLARAGVAETVVVSPDRVAEDIRFSRRVKAEGFDITLAGQIRAHGAEAESEIEQSVEILDRIDLLMPLSEQELPVGGARKISVLLEALDFARSRTTQVGIGFPYATEASPLFLLEIAQHTTRAGAQRITLYDTTGEAEPFSLRTTLEELIAEVGVPVFFHARDHLGLAAANSWAAVLAGARGLGVSIQGLAAGPGNASLEQVAELMERNGVPTGIVPGELAKLGHLRDSNE